MPNQVTIILTPAEVEVCQKLAIASSQSISDVAKQAFKSGLLLNLKAFIEVVASLDVSKLVNENKETSITPKVVSITNVTGAKNYDRKEDADAKLVGIRKDVDAINTREADKQYPKKCLHHDTEYFEDGAMYRCKSCGASGITGSGKEPV